MRIRPYTFVLLSALLIGWFGAGLLLVPVLLRAVFAGRGPAFLHDLLNAHPDVSAQFVLQEWYGVVMAGAAAIILLAWMWHALNRPRFAERIVGEARPSDIGAIRMLVSAVLLTSVLWEDVASTAALPRGMIGPMGVMQLLHLIPNFDAFLASEWALRLLDLAAAVLLMMALVGWKARFAVPLAAAAYLVVGGVMRQYAWFYHTGLLPLYLLIVLSFLPSGAGLSMDRWLKKRRGDAVPPDEPSRSFGWMRYALWATLAIPYVAAGLSKLRNGGLTWWEASNFKFILYHSTLRPMEFDFDISLLLTSAPDAVFEILAISAVAGEILYGLVLFSRLGRWIMPATMALMHVAILFMQNILFFDLIILQAIFYDFRPAAAWAARTYGGWMKPALAFAAGSSVSPGPAPGIRAWSIGPRFTMLLVGFLVFFWVFRIEFYPFTGMQMFSTKRTEPVRYETVLAHLSSGDVVRAPIEQCIGAMSDSRYRRVIEMAFQEDRESITAEFLSACQRRWNRTVDEPARQIDRFEVQQWEWYFLGDPTNPRYGDLIARRIYPPAQAKKPEKMASDPRVR